MPRSVTRELTISYNDVTMGGSDEDYRLTGFIRMRQEPEIGQAEWDVLVVGSSESAFAANCVDFEEKLSEPWNDIKIAQGSSILLDVKASDTENTALNPSITVQKVGTTTDSGRTRRYHCVATWGRSYTPARRASVSVSGTYTAVTSNLARAQYDAKIAAFTTAVLTAISGSATFELVEEDSSHDVNDKTLTFTRIFDEVIFTQGGTGLDNANIVSQNLDITAGRRSGEGHTSKSSIEGLGSITLRYSAWFDKDQTTALESKYDGIRSWLITQAEEFAQGGLSLALMEEDPSFDPVENKISVTMRFQSASGSATGTHFFEIHFTVEDNVEYGYAAVHAWTGSPFSKYVYQAEANAIRTIRMTALASGDGSQADAKEAFQAFAGPESSASGRAAGEGPAEAAPLTDPLSGGGTWFTRSRRVSADPYKVGIPGKQIELTRMTGEAVRFWAELIEGGAAITPGGGPAPGPTTP